ncbi:hypothetical protein Pmani_004793 [Petrolisthes manimaculis]|uniref:Uncharacterized protein n=1 Tax=Petrolisthes manimaculis TaxID=1843537 RepID=A0AAE1QG61_9EUCA|nr:hypothetical protein Pmani_004793 [Petrolisthes manimaculis]
MIVAQAAVTESESLERTSGGRRVVVILNFLRLDVIRWALKVNFKDGKPQGRVVRGEGWSTEIRDGGGSVGDVLRFRHGEGRERQRQVR